MTTHTYGKRLRHCPKCENFIFTSLDYCSKCGVGYLTEQYTQESGIPLTAAGILFCLAIASLIGLKILGYL